MVATFATVGNDDKVDGRIATAIAASAATAIGQLTKLDKLASFGDSLTASTGTDWPTAVGTDLGIIAVNLGYSGYASSDIAVNQGAIQPLLTVTGNSIPASGAVTVTAFGTAGSFRDTGSGSLFFNGTLAGVYGTLTHTQDPSAGWSFTRALAGAVTPCPAASPFIVSVGDQYRNHIQTLWVGRNNFSPNSLVEDVIRDTDLMVRRLNTDRYLVIGVTNSASEIIGTTNYAALTKVNTWLAARHGNKFVDIRRELVDNGLHVMGLSYTSGDIAQTLTDTTPDTIKLDTLHFSGPGYQFIGRVIAQRIRDLGYVPGKLPLVTPVAPTGLTVGTATATTLPLTWTATPGATGYAVNYRLTGATTWVPAFGSAIASGTITGLTSGTAYDIQLVAYNVDGASPAVTGTGTAAGSLPVVLTSDSFNRADTTSGVLGTTDIATGGSALAWVSDSQLQILSNKLGATALSTTRVCRVNVGVSDHRVEANFPVFPGGGVIARFTDASNYYSTSVNSSGVGQLTKRVAGVNTIIGSPGNFAAGDTIGLSAIGSTLVIYRNGIAIFTRTGETSLVAGTYAGILSAFNDATFRADDFKVYDH